MKKFPPAKIAANAKSCMLQLLRELNKGLKSMGYKLVATIELEKIVTK